MPKNSASNLGPTVAEAKAAMIEYHSRPKSKKSRASNDKWKPTWHERRFEAADLPKNAHKNSQGRWIARELARLWNDGKFWHLLSKKPTIAEIAAYVTDSHFPFSAKMLGPILLRGGWNGWDNTDGNDPAAFFYAMVHNKKRRHAFYQMMIQKVIEASPVETRESEDCLKRLKDAEVDAIFIQYLFFPEFDLRELVRRANLGKEDLEKLANAASNLAEDIQSLLTQPKPYFPDALRAKKKAKRQIKSLRSIDKLVHMLKADPTLSATKAAAQLEEELGEQVEKAPSAATDLVERRSRRLFKVKPRADLRQLARHAELLVKYREKISRSPIKNSGWGES